MVVIANNHVEESDISKMANLDAPSTCPPGKDNQNNEHLCLNKNNWRRVLGYIKEVTETLMFTETMDGHMENKRKCVTSNHHPLTGISWDLGGISPYDEKVGKWIPTTAIHTLDTLNTLQLGSPAVLKGTMSAEGVVWSPHIWDSLREGNDTILCPAPCGPYGDCCVPSWNKNHGFTVSCSRNEKPQLSFISKAKPPLNGSPVAWHTQAELQATLTPFPMGPSGVGSTSSTSSPAPLGQSWSGIFRAIILLHCLRWSNTLQPGTVMSPGLSWSGTSPPGESEPWLSWAVMHPRAELTDYPTSQGNRAVAELRHHALQANNSSTLLPSC